MDEYIFKSNDCENWELGKWERVQILTVTCTAAVATWCILESGATESEGPGFKS